MRIRVMCDKNELERTQAIQDIFNGIFKELSENGFRGTLTIEEQSSEDLKAKK